jgi:hypothetical protein
MSLTFKPVDPRRVDTAFRTVTLEPGRLEPPGSPWRKPS